MTSIIRFLPALVVVMAGSWAAIAHGQFTPRVIWTLGEGDDGATADGESLGNNEAAPPGAVIHDTAVWIEQAGDDAGTDVDYDTDFVIGNPTWSTDTRGPQSDYSLRVDGNEGISAPGRNWWQVWNAGGNFRLGVQAWIKPDPSIEGIGEEIPLMQEAIGIGIDPEGRWRYTRNGFQNEANRGVFWDFVDGTGDIAKVQYGEWQHVAARTDGSSWDIYVNGTKVSTTNSNNFTYGGTGGFRNVGVDQNDAGNFAGWIDDVQWFWWDGGPDDFGQHTQFVEELVNGDVDGDLDVDSDDFDIWRENIGLNTIALPGTERIAVGDVDFNGTVDLNDFRIIKDNKTPPSAGGTIPEPASLALMSMSAVAALAVRRRRSN